MHFHVPIQQVSLRALIATPVATINVRNTCGFDNIQTAMQLDLPNLWSRVMRCFYGKIPIGGSHSVCFINVRYINSAKAKEAGNIFFIHILQADHK